MKICKKSEKDVDKSTSFSLSSRFARVVISIDIIDTKVVSNDMIDTEVITIDMGDIGAISNDINNNFDRYRC